MPKLILIAGVSRSGKTTLAQKLTNDLPRALWIHQDEYTVSKQLLPSIKDRIDWEDPDSIDWVKLKKSYREAKSRYEYIIIEGIFAFYDLSIIQEAAFTICLKISKLKFYQRRSLETRWGEEPEWFLDHVWQSHLKFENPHNITPDITLSEESLIEYDDLLTKISTV